MARIRKGNSPGPVAVRRLAAKQSGPGADSGEANAKPHPVQRVTEFPKPPAADDIVSDRIIFEIGGDRFAIHWTAEIEQLLPAGPVAVERKQRPKSDRLPQTRRSLLQAENDIRDPERICLPASEQDVDSGCVCILPMREPLPCVSCRRLQRLPACRIQRMHGGYK